MKKLLSVILSVLMAVVVLFEEWLWFRLLDLAKKFMSLPFIKAIDPFIRRQNKWVSLGLFIIPELSFIPVKMAVLWLFGNDHIYTGIILFVAAKISGTAIFAWMYSVTEPKITQFFFIRWIRDKIQMIRKWAHEWFRRRLGYRFAKLRLRYYRAQFSAAIAALAYRMKG